MADNHLNEAERTQDEADALADLRKAVQAGASDDWLLGFIRGCPFARRTPVADGAAADLPALPKPNAWRIGADGEWHYGSMNHCKRIRAEFEESFKDEPHEEPEGVYTAEQYQQGQREAISHYLRKQAGQVGEQPTKGESNAGA